MITILANIGTDQIRTRFEESAVAHRFDIEEWLTPSDNGKGLRVAATMKIKGQKHGLGFKWDGDDINELASRCIALDYAMQKLPEMVARGKGAPWKDRTIQ